MVLIILTQITVNIIPPRNEGILTPRLDSNINIQMNYWSAEMSNMDVTQSVFDYIQVMSLHEYLVVDLTSSAEYLGSPWCVHRSGFVQHQRGICNTW